MMIEMRDMDKLVECVHHPILDPVRGEITCSECGLVMGKMLVSSTYAMENSMSEFMNRTTQFTELGDWTNIVDGLGSYIGSIYSRFFVDYHGIPLSGKNQQLFNRLKYHFNMMIRINERRSDYRALLTLNRVCGMLGKTNHGFKNRAGYLYKKFVNRLKRKEYNSRFVLVGCAIYLTSKEMDTVPFTVHHLTRVFLKLKHRVTAKLIIRIAMVVKRRFPEVFANIRVKRCEDYLDALIYKITADAHVQERLRSNRIDDVRVYERELRREAMEILQQIPNRERVGRNPYNLCGAVIYAAGRQIMGWKRKIQILTLKRIGRILEVSEFSMRYSWTQIVLPKIEYKTSRCF